MAYLVHLLAFTFGHWSWLSFITFVGLVTSVILLLRSLLKPRQTFPVVKGNGEAGLSTAILDGYQKYPSSPFIIPTSDFPTIVLPHSCVDEIGNLPESKLSLDREVYERLMGGYTGLVKSELFTNFVKLGVQKHVDKTLEVLQEESEWAVRTELPQTKDWVSVNLFPTVINLVSLHLGRSFVGLPTSRNKEWIQLAIEYAILTVTVATKMSECYWLWRPVKGYFLPEIQYMKSKFRKAAATLEPALRQRLKDSLNPRFERPNDLMQWIIDSSAESRENLDMHTRYQIEAIQAATFNVAFQVIHFFYDLVAHPEFREPLLAEMENYITREEQITQQKLLKLRKLDSFLKESQRLNAMSLVSVRRFILEPIKLSDGSILEPGMSVAAPTYAVDRDPSIWEGPTEFDGFRFDRLRLKDGNELKLQFSSSSAQELNWGYGIHACPGRHFTSNQIKVLIIEILRNYDFRMEASDQSRPLNRVQGVLNSPDPTAKLQFRLRRRC